MRGRVNDNLYLFLGELFLAPYMMLNDGQNQHKHINSEQVKKLACKMQTC